MHAIRLWPILLAAALVLPAGGCQFLRDQQQHRTVHVRMGTSENRTPTVENPIGERTVAQEPNYEGDTWIFIVAKHW